MNPAQKLDLVIQLLDGLETCPSCGHIIADRPSLITIEQAKGLLGFEEETSERASRGSDDTKD